MGPIRVFLVDDNDDFISGVSEWLIADPRVDFVGTAADGVRAVERIRQHKPDVVLLNESIPDMNCGEAIRRIKSAPSPPAVILVTFHDGATARQQATAAGADGVVAKARIIDCLMPTIERLLGRQPQRRSSKTKPSRLKRRGPSEDLSR